MAITPFLIILGILSVDYTERVQLKGLEPLFPGINHVNMASLPYLLHFHILESQLHISLCTQL